MRTWWADPAAALTMVPLIGWEGVRALRGGPVYCDDCARDPVTTLSRPRR